MDATLARSWILATAESITAHADRLTALDSAIGDGDHGSNLRRGFDAAVAALAAAAPATAADVFVKTGTTLVSKVGGASGPLFGTFFRALGKALPDTVDAAAFTTGLQAALDAVQQLGKATEGDKTMIDALAPAVAAYAAALSTPAPTGPAVTDPPLTAPPLTDPAAAGMALAARAAAQAAVAGAERTVGLRARKGRASYLGERSVGHQDPGATSTSLLFVALADVYGSG